MQHNRNGAKCTRRTVNVAAVQLQDLKTPFGVKASHVLRICLGDIFMAVPKPMTSCFWIQIISIEMLKLNYHWHKKSEKMKVRLWKMLDSAHAPGSWRSLSIKSIKPIFQFLSFLLLGGRYKKEVLVDGQSHLLLIREESSLPTAQVCKCFFFFMCML